MELEEAIGILKYELDKSKVCKKYQTHTVDFLKDLDDYIQAIETVLNHLAKQEKMVEMIKTRIFVSSEEHEQILKIQEKHRDKSYEDCTLEYFEKKAEEAE